LTTADPAQRCFRIAADGVVNQRLDGLWQTWLGCLRAPVPGARTPDARTDLVAGLLQFGDPTNDRAARDPCRRGNRACSASPQRQGFIGGEQAAAPLVEKRLQSLKSAAQAIGVHRETR